MAANVKALQQTWLARIQALFDSAAKFVAMMSGSSAESSRRIPTAAHHWCGSSLGNHAVPTRNSLAPDPLGCASRHPLWKCASQKFVVLISQVRQPLCQNTHTIRCQIALRPFGQASVEWTSRMRLPLYQFASLVSRTSFRSASIPSLFERLSELMWAGINVKSRPISTGTCIMACATAVLPRLSAVMRSELATATLPSLAA